MEVPRHVLQTYIRTNEFPLIQHHKDSFNALLNTEIPTFIKATNPLILDLGVTNTVQRYVRVYVGGKNGDKIRYASPVEPDGTAVVPHSCRLNNTTYALSIHADILIEYEIGKKTHTQTFADTMIGQIPLMLHSQYWYTR